MNQLIIDRLVAQSTDDILGVPVLDRSRFAKLIVQECINGIANDTANYEGVGMMSYYQGVQDALKSIHNHFGVEA